MPLSPTDDLDRHPCAPAGALGDRVPVIDLAALPAAGVARDAAAQAAIDAIASACREWGFFQIVNHDVDAALVASVRDHAVRFFAQDSAALRELTRTLDNPWGYYNRELTKNQRDKKQVFDFTDEGVDGIYRARNRWPASPIGFRDVMLRWHAACTALCLRLLDAVCLGLDVPPSRLRAAFAPRHTSFVRLNHYPVSDPTARDEVSDERVADMGVHHHTDAGALTLLLQDDVGGLQVHRDGQWHDVPPMSDAFVVNTGDMLQVWSNDRYRAAMHRALAMHDTDRYSIPYFFNPAADARVRPLDELVSRRHPPRYRDIAWAAFRGQRTEGDYADYGAENQIADYRI